MRFFGPPPILFIQRCLFPIIFSILLDPIPVDFQVRPAHSSPILLFRYAIILSLLSIFRNSLSEPRLTVDNFSKRSVIKNLH